MIPGHFEDARAMPQTQIIENQIIAIFFVKRRRPFSTNFMSDFEFDPESGEKAREFEARSNVWLCERMKRRGRRGQDSFEELVYFTGMAHDQGVACTGNNIVWLGASRREDLIPGAMDLNKWLGDRFVAPIKDCCYRPGDKPVIAGPDDIAHDFPVFPGFHRQRILDFGQKFQQGGAGQF